MPFTFYSTVHSFTEEKLKILLDNKAKIIWMKLGLQTASERVNRYRRRFNKKAFLDKIELILSHNINLRLDMLLQNPYEEASDWAENIDFFYELGQRIRKKRLPKRKIRLNLFSLRFYPDTELYDRTLKDGIIDKDYIDTVLTKRSKYNFGRLAPYAPTAFSVVMFTRANTV